MVAQTVKMVENREKYETIGKLGEGGYGAAFKCRSKLTGKYFVIKRINTEHLSDAEKKEVRNESKILQALNHPNIIKFERAFKDK